MGMTVSSSQSVTPGVYTVTVLAKYGASTTTYDLTVDVAKYLIVAQNYAFHPGNLTVPQGSTIYWVNFDVSNSGSTPEAHNVVFTSGSSAQSPRMDTYDSWSYTFSTPGTYSYFSALNPLMTGTITVTA